MVFVDEWWVDLIASDQDPWTSCFKGETIQIYCEFSPPV